MSPTSTPPETPLSTGRRSSAGWALVLGLALAAVGVARAQEDTGNTTVVQQSYGLSGFATADSNNRMIAVTGIDLTGASILYVIDTENPHVAVYQATGGSQSTQGIRLVGARRIDLDLALDGLNDKSEYSYKDLEGKFGAQGLLPGAAEDSE